MGRGWMKYLMVAITLPIISMIILAVFKVPIPSFENMPPMNDELLKGEDPIILWWHQTGTESFNYYKTCGTNRCYFTESRKHQHDTRTKAFLFYGTFLRPYDLPLPRLKHHEWGLLHEESPKNYYIFSHAEVMELFNHTATFKRESTYPMPTIWLESLEWLESKAYFKSTTEKNRHLSELAPIAYIQGDCDAPSGRDDIVKEMMKYIQIDSYGKCLHNKDLQERLANPLKKMMDPEFFEFLSRYKFVFAMENALCDDYMTEKLWRPLHIGSVPIVLGSSRVQDFMPSNHSVILVQDYKSIKELSDYIAYLNENDSEYDKYLTWKHNGVDNTYLKMVLAKRDTELAKFGFECHVCNKIHENLQRVKLGKPERTFHASKSHYGCPGPVYYKEGETTFDKKRPLVYHYYASKYEAKAIRHFIKKGKPFTDEEYYMYLNKLTKGNLRIVRDHRN